MDPQVTGPINLWRRKVLIGSIATLFAIAITRRTKAANVPLKGETSISDSNEWTDRVAITDVIMRERWARETYNAEVAASCFHSEAWIEVSWFKDGLRNARSCA